MTDNAERKTLMERYLLGQVSQEERAKLEDQYLHDDDLFEELVAAENDMIDAYAKGKLAEPERREFEAHFLSTPERQERLQFARALMNPGSTPMLSAQDEERPRSGRLTIPTFPGAQILAVRFAIATALLAAVFGVSWMAVINHKLHQQLEIARTGQANAQRQAQELSGQIADLQARAAVVVQTQPFADPPAPGSAILSMTLVSDLSRSGGKQTTLQLSPGIAPVLFLLQREHRKDDESAIYRVVLETAEGGQLWQRRHLAHRATRDGDEMIKLEIPPDILNRGDYVLRLFRTATSGRAEEVATYSFRVVRR